MAIQQLVDVHPDGDFGPDAAQGVARFQQDMGIEPVDGMVGEITIDAMLAARPVVVDAGLEPAAEAVAAQSRAFTSALFVHLVAELFDLPISSEALSVRLVDRQMATHETRFEAGNARVILLGVDAFTSTATLRDTLAEALVEAPPEVAEPGERPTLLTPAEERDAVDYGRDRLPSGSWSTRIVQGVVGAVPDGSWGPDTVERIAELQDTHDLGDVDGKVGVETLEVVRKELHDRGDFDAIVRLVAEYFDLDATGLLDMGADADLPMLGSGSVGGAITLGFVDRGRSPSIVRIKPSALASLGSAITTIAHELVHVRQFFAGDARRTADQEFEAHSEEVLLAGALDPRLVQSALIFDKAQVIVNRLFWDMFPDSRQAQWSRFQEVRRVARSRFDALPEAERATFAHVMEALDAVTDPLERPEQTLD